MKHPVGPNLWQFAAIAALAGCSYQTGSIPPHVSTSSRSAGGYAQSSAPYLYVENNNSTISVFAVASSGALTEIPGSPYDSQTNGPANFSIAIDGKGPYLYATGTSSGNVAVFSIGGDGGLTSVSTSTDAGVGASFLLLPKGDRRAYVLNSYNGGQVDAFDLSKTGRKLKAVKNSPYGVTCPGFCDPNPTSAVTSGRFLYTVDTYGWYVSSFSIAANGSLTELNSYATGYGPADAVLTPKGSYLYVTDGAQANVTAYRVANGVLTALAGSPFPAGVTPLGITITPSGTYVYVANSGDATISGYAITAGGALKTLAGSPFSDGSNTGPTALIADKSGKHLFVTNSNTENIGVFQIKANGALAQVPNSPFAESGATGPKGLALYQP
ncbi:MAG TPA: beta-propeller fold lactonase family protein [Candidatus Cybelea sp.]